MNNDIHKLKKNILNMIREISILLLEKKELEIENAILKKALEEAGISFRKIKIPSTEISDIEEYNEFIRIMKPVMDELEREG